jgi:preflagellin peptidase FlaK
LDFLGVTEYVSILVTLFFFGLGSVFDLKTREAPDKVWLTYGPLGLALTVYRVLGTPSSLVLTAISIALGIPISFGLFYFGLLGGADAKAMICLALTLPLAPESYHPLIGYVHPFFPIVVLMMSFIASASVALWLGVRNLIMFLTERSKMFEGLEREGRWKRILASITGYPTAISKLDSTFYLYPMERVVEDESGDHRTFQLFVSAEADRNELVSILSESLRKVGSPSRVWVTPGLPMLLFILVGLIVTLILGDPILTTVMTLARH